jgi:hypothetical protein
MDDYGLDDYWSNQGMDLIAAAAGARATSMILLWAGWSSWRPRARVTMRYGTARGRADASVRCTGLGATMSQSTWHLFEPVVVDAHSCDSTSLLLHRWFWSRQLKRIFKQPYNSIHDTRLWVKVGLTSEARGPIYYSDSNP